MRFLRAGSGAAFRRLLVPTDGSARSRAAETRALALARELGARVTGLFVIASGVPTAFSGAKLYTGAKASRRIRAAARDEAAAALGELERRARTAGVPCRSLRRTAREPWRAILRAARSERCGLIVMGSHGRGAVKSALLGSQTLKVLAHSRIPVLVCR